MFLLFLQISRWSAAEITYGLACYICSFSEYCNHQYDTFRFIFLIYFSIIRKKENSYNEIA
jgi:hypothetical protein